MEFKNNISSGLIGSSCDIITTFLLIIIYNYCVYVHT